MKHDKHRRRQTIEFQFRPVEPLLPGTRSNKQSFPLIRQCSVALSRIYFCSRPRTDTRGLHEAQRASNRAEIYFLRVSGPFRSLPTRPRLFHPSVSVKATPFTRSPNARPLRQSARVPRGMKVCRRDTRISHPLFCALYATRHLFSLSMPLDDRRDYRRFSDCRRAVSNVAPKGCYPRIRYAFEGSCKIA